MSTRLSFFSVKGLTAQRLSAIADGMAREVYDCNSTAGFIVEKRSARSVEGRYIRKLSFVSHGTDPFGEPFETTTVEYSEQRFLLNLKAPQLIFLNSSASARPLIGRISEFADFSISISPGEFSTEKLCQEFAKNFEHLRIYAASVQEIKLSPTAIVQLRFQATDDDVRTHVRRFLGNRKAVFDSIKVEFTYAERRRRAELTTDGEVQLYGEDDPTLRDIAIDAVTTQMR